jgi:hypothetical protein
MRALPSIVLPIAIALLTSACITRTVDQEVFSQDGVNIWLRSQKTWLSEVERDFQHPAVISGERLTHILAAIDIETRDPKDDEALKQRKVAIHPVILAEVANGMAESFEEASPNQELIVVAVRKQRRLGLFHRKFLTSLSAFMEGDFLHIELSRIEWEIPKNREDEKLPRPRGKKAMKFRAVPARGMHNAGTQTVVVPWRRSLYARPLRAPSVAGGDVQRRTILMESPIPLDELEPQQDSIPANLDPGVLRALADLEEDRRAGAITETEYQQKKALLLGETRL